MYTAFPKTLYCCPIFWQKTKTSIWSRLFWILFHKRPWFETNLERDLLLRRSAERLLCRPEEGLLFLSAEWLLDLDLLADFFFSSSLSVFSSFFSSVPFSLTDSFTLQQENHAATFHTAYNQSTFSRTKPIHYQKFLFKIYFISSLPINIKYSSSFRIYSPQIWKLWKLSFKKSKKSLAFLEFKQLKTCRYTWTQTYMH